VAVWQPLRRIGREQVRLSGMVGPERGRHGQALEQGRRERLLPDSLLGDFLRRKLLGSIYWHFCAL
jgi:hypothetical protein